MKYVIIGDNHWGLKGFSEYHFKIMIKYYKEEVIPYMINNNIKKIIHMGDLFENRVKMDINFFNMFIDEFISLLRDNNIEFITIIGNHDIYFKNRNDISLVKYLPHFYDGIKVINSPTELNINNNSILLIPWLDDLEYKDYAKHNYIFGHFEMSDIFEHLKGDISPSTFQGKDIKAVFSGHYHNKSQKGKILYVGTPYQTSWGDCGDSKGIWDLNLETDSIKFIENKISPIFIKIKYNEVKETPYCIEGIDTEELCFKNIDEVIKEIDKLTDPKIKIFINSANTKNYVSDVYLLKTSGYQYELFDNVELKSVTGVDVVKTMEQEKTKINFNSESDTLKFIYDNLDDELTELLNKVKDIDL
jgi:DNA repair exonuclease SbcCD nuclease subunit